MANDRYIPSPMGVSHIQLSPHLSDLTELLACHAHDVWAAQRMSEGWTWGPERCDHRRTHPCLVPYEELPESEKEYDRQTVTGTLKAIIALGYAISSPNKAIHTDGNSATLHSRR